jgi:hypothetical protein
MEQQRKQWLVAALITTLLAWLILSCLSCRSRTDRHADAPIILYADTNRVKLQHRADASRDSLLILRQRTQQTQMPYETAAAAYDTLRVVLPD